MNISFVPAGLKTARCRLKGLIKIDIKMNKQQFQIKMSHLRKDFFLLLRRKRTNVTQLLRFIENNPDLALCV